MQFEILDRLDAARPRAEEMIRSVYRDRYGARLAGFPDRLAAVLDRKGEPICAAGLRDAECGFFSEIYLDRPVEREIAKLAREPVSRNSILEVTTLAAARPGAAFQLIDYIAANSTRGGMRWGLFTATRPLRHGLLRAGAGFIELKRADRSRVADPCQWGRYYETDPFVCAVSGDACQSRASHRHQETDEVRLHA